MALTSPSNINLISSNTTAFRIAFRSTLSNAANLYLLLTPKIYTDFTHDINSEVSIPSGNNRYNDETLQWSKTIFSNVMRGISYDLSIALKTSNDSSDYVSTSISLTRPFFQTALNTANTPGFTISGVTIPTNRVTDSVFSTGEIEYIGTWHSYPRIVLTGQFNYCKVVNTGTKAEVGISAIVPNNEIRVLETNPLEKQYGLWGGTDEESLENMEHELTDESNIRRFIFPAKNMLVRPLAIEAYFYGRSNSTRLDVKYPVRYFELGENYI